MHFGRKNEAMLYLLVERIKIIPMVFILEYMTDCPEGLLNGYAQV